MTKGLAVLLLDQLKFRKLLKTGVIKGGYPTDEKSLPSRSRLVLICNIVSLLILVCADFFLLLQSLFETIRPRLRQTVGERSRGRNLFPTEGSRPGFFSPRIVWGCRTILKRRCLEQKQVQEPGLSCQEWREGTHQGSLPMKSLSAFPSRMQRKAQVVDMLTLISCILQFSFVNNYFSIPAQSVLICGG